MSPLIGLIALAVSLLTSVVAVTAVIVQMRTNVECLTRENGRREEREDSAAKEVHEFFALLKSFIAAQTEINKQVEIGLTGAMDKLAELQHQVNESETVKELLIEIVKKKGAVSIEP